MCANALCICGCAKTFVDPRVFAHVGYIFFSSSFLLCGRSIQTSTKHTLRSILRDYGRVCGCGGRRANDFSLSHHTNRENLFDRFGFSLHYFACFLHHGEPKCLAPLRASGELDYKQSSVWHQSCYQFRTCNRVKIIASLITWNAGFFAVVATQCACQPNGKFITFLR